MYMPVLFNQQIMPFPALHPSQGIFFTMTLSFNCHLENYLCVPWLEFLREYNLFSLDLVSIPGPISCGQGWALVTGANVHLVGARCRPFEKGALLGQAPQFVQCTLHSSSSYYFTNFDFCSSLRTDFIGLNL